MAPELLPMTVAVAVAGSAEEEEEEEEEGERCWISRAASSASVARRWA